MFDRIFFVLSPSFHGATLLSKLLNAHPEVVSLGDTYPSNQFDQVCGCGKNVSQCEFWQAVKTETHAHRYTGKTRLMLPIYPGEQGGLLGRIMYNDLTSFWATPRAIGRLQHGETLQTFRDEFYSFLTAVHKHTRKVAGIKSVFVDGVKSIARMTALNAAGVQVNGLIHIYRESDDFVFSSMRNTGRGSWSGLVEHSLRYSAYHARARQASRYSGGALILNYEKLASDVDAELARIFRYLGVCPMTIDELRPNLNQEWHFMGNASLFGFNGAIRRSRHQLGPGKRLLVRLLVGRPIES